MGSSHVKDSVRPLLQQKGFLHVAVQQRLTTGQEGDGHTDCSCCPASITPELGEAKMGWPLTDHVTPAHSQAQLNNQTQKHC